MKKMLMNKKGLRNHVQKYRVWQGLLQKDLTEKVNISVSEIRLIEHQAVAPRPGTRFKLAEFFGIRHDQLFYYEEWFYDSTQRSSRLL